MAASRLLHQSSAHYPSSKPDTYVYSIIPCLSTSGLALIDSADELLILDRLSLRNRGGSLPRVPQGVTCLTGVDESGNVVAASGRDGSIAVWDLRSGEQVARYVEGEAFELQAVAGEGCGSLTCARSKSTSDSIGLQQFGS